MSNPASLSILIDQANNETDTAFRLLQKLSEELRGARSQLSQLYSYRHDYAQRLQKETQAGVSASNYQNFRRFIATLDQAILQQNTVVARIEEKLQRGRQQWQGQKRRLNSYETLLERNLRDQRIRASRTEQRASDEISGNLLRRAAQSH